MNIQLAVIMIDGSLAPVAQREQWLEMYKYQKNPTIPDRWDLLSSSADDEGAALIIKDDGERIELVGESSTNITQACYIAARIGWTSCRIVEAPSQDVYRIFVERLNIELEEPAPADPFGADTFTLEDDESDMGATATQPNGQGVHIHEAPLVFDLEHEDAGTLPSAAMHSAEQDTIRDIEVLTIRANDAEMNVDRLEDALLKSQNEVQQLRQQLANQQRQDTSDNASIKIKSPMIIMVLERHIADLLSEHIGKQVPLVNELEALGFNCKVNVALSSSATDTHS
jgi:hypothetical protein